MPRFDNDNRKMARLWAMTASAALLAAAGAAMGRPAADDPLSGPAVPPDPMTERGPRDGGFGPERAPGWARDLLLEKFDANGDGELDDAEREAAAAFVRARVDEHRTRLLAEYDADGDGELSREERRAAAEAGDLPRGPREGRGGPGGPDREALVAEFDADGDGELTGAEREAARAAVRERHAAKRAEIVARFDADGDGELSPEERRAARQEMGPRKDRKNRDARPGRGGPGGPEQRAKVLERFDANGDGELDETERHAARSEMQRRRAEMIGRFDADGDGRLAGEERRAALEARRSRQAGGRAMRELDANGDRVLDAGELAGALELFAAGDARADVTGDGAVDRRDYEAIVERATRAE